VSGAAKAEIVPLLDDVDQIARAVGAVTTVVLRNDRLLGYNAECDGFRELIEHLDLRLVYGVRAGVDVVVAVLRSLGVDDISLAGRNVRTTATTLGVRLYDKRREPPTDLFVNCGGRVLPGALPPSHAAAKPNDDDDYEKNDPAVFWAAPRGATTCFDWTEHHSSALVDFCRKRGVDYVPGSAAYWPRMTADWKLFLRGVVPPADLANLRETLQLADHHANGRSSSALTI